MLSSAYEKHGRLEGSAGAPVMTVDRPMYQVCQTLSQIQASMLPTSTLKIDHAKVTLHTEVLQSVVCYACGRLVDCSD